MIYEYQCSSCEKVWDRLLSTSRALEPESEPCPHCQAEGSVKKIMSRTGMIQFDVSMTKPTGEFRELLQQIKKNNKHSTMDV
jgi:putative FmdB family regulatory protein